MTSDQEIFAKVFVQLNQQSLITNADHVSNLITSRILNSTLYDEALKLYRIADSVYPGECDLQLWPVTNGDSPIITYQLFLCIHFPNLIVNNTQNVNHPIKDMFFGMILDMKDDRIMIEHYRGQRTTITYTEYKSHYRFSHLKTTIFSDPPKYMQFCFGSGDLPKLKILFNSTVDIVAGGNVSRDEVFKMICFNIEPYLSWESLEGGPFQKIRELFEQDKMYYDSIVSNYTYESYLIKLLKKENFKFLDCDIIFTNGKYVVSDNARLNDSLVEIVKLWISKEGLLFSKHSDGNLYIRKNVSSTPTRRTTPILSDIPVPFQQRMYQYTVEDDIVEEVVVDNKLYINPLFKQNVRKSIESTINKQIYTSDFIERFQHKIKAGQEY